MKKASKKSVPILLALLLALALSACGGKTADTPAPAAPDNVPAQETQQSAPTQNAAPAEPAPTTEPPAAPSEADAPAPEFVNGGELSWEDEERLDGILAEYVGTYRNAGGKYMMITGEQASFVFQPSKIGAFEGNVSIYTWKDGEDYYTNKYKMEGDNKVTVLCEGRAGHYAEGVKITFAFEDGTITVSCGDETETFAQSDKQ